MYSQQALRGPLTSRYLSVRFLPATSSLRCLCCFCLAVNVPVFLYISFAVYRFYCSGKSIQRDFSIVKREISLYRTLPFI